MNNNRVTARVDEETFDLLTKATELSGLKNISSFIVNSSVEKAKLIVIQDKLKNLSEEQINKLLNIEVL